jgi:tetratricopeptide (TPR) repeat protein
MPARSRPQLLQQAQQCLQTRRYLEAEAIGRQLLAAHEGDVDALVILAVVADAKGQYDVAADHLERCVRLQPGNPRLLLRLARALQDAGRLEAALNRFDQLARLQPGLPAAIAGRADVLARRGARDEALAELEPCIDAGREDAAMAVLYVRLKTQAGDCARAVEIARRHADGPGEPGVIRQLHFELGAAYEKSGAYDDAFAAYARANELAPVQFDPQAAVERADRLIEVCTRETLTRLPRAEEAGDAAVFVIGMPRSGTTLVERILDAHPEVHGGGELDGIPQIVDNLPERIGSTLPWPACIRDLEPDDVESLGAIYLEQIRALAPDARRIADKQLGNDQALGVIALLLPRSRVISCRRDPMDTCFSCFARDLVPELNPYASDLRWLGLMFRQRERLMAHWQRELDLSILTVQYEALVEDQAGVSRRIIEFCGLDWDDRCLRYYERADPAHTLSYDQVRQPIYTTSVGRARRFERHLGPLREALAAPDDPG